MTVWATLVTRSLGNALATTADLLAASLATSAATLAAALTTTTTAKLAAALADVALTLTFAVALGTERLLCLLFDCWVDFWT